MFKFLRDRWLNDVFFRLGAAVFLSVTAASSLNTAFAIRSLRVNAEAELQERVVNMGAVLSKALARPLFDINSLAIASVGDAIGLDPQVTRLRILASDGTVLVSGGVKVDAGVRTITLNQDISYTAQGKTHRVGSIEMSLSSADADRKLQGQIAQAAVTGLVVILATLTALYLVGRRMVRPFRDVEIALDRLASGHSDIRLSGIGRTDQIGRLSEAVDRFRNALDSLRLAEQKTAILLEEKTNMADKLKAIYDSSNDAVMLLTGRGFFDCNQRTLEMFNVDSREAFIQYHPADLSPAVQPDGRASMDAANEHIMHAFATGESRFEWMHSRLNGAPFPAEVLLSAFEYEGERVLQATVRDITQRKVIEHELQNLNSDLESRIALRTREMAATLEQLAESRQKLQGIVDTALDAVVRVDADGMIIGWNRQAQNIFGWTADSVIGQALHLTIIPPQHREAHLSGMARYIATCASSVIDRRIEISAMHKSGRQFPIELAITRVTREDSNKFEFCSFIRDISRRKQAEEEIRNSLERQWELIQLKSRFISMASHEFRTPLATILSSADLLQNYIDRLSASERDELFKSISIAVRRMTKMLEDILTIGKDEAEYSKFSPSLLAIDVFFDSMIGEICAKQEIADAPKPEIRLHVSGDSRQGLLDEVLMRHIFENLLSNAVKYSPKGSVVDFNVRCSPEAFHFTVTDYGIGIPEPDLPRLFESFHRATNVGNIPGTGLGLAIVKRSVDQHGGTITVVSTVGEGTTFSVSLPRSSFVDAENGCGTSTNSK